jgi:hypothetical protein
VAGVDLDESVQTQLTSAWQQAIQSIRETWRLLLAAIVMLVPAAYFTVRYPFPGHTNELVDLGILSHYTHRSFWVFVALMAIWFVAYVVGLRVSRSLDQRQALSIVLLTGALMGGVMTYMYPTNANDIYLYAARSRLFTAHGENPIAVTPDAYPNDPWRRYVTPEWADDTSPYGPAWNLVAAPITLAAGDNMSAALAGFKVLAVVCYLTIGWLIARVLSLIPDSRPASGALLFLWNPLVLWEGVGNGHNDLLVTLILVAAIYAWQRGWVRWVIPALVMAALVKFFALLLIPLAAVTVVRRARDITRAVQHLLWSAALSLAAVAIGFAPFYDARAVIDSARKQGDIVTTSLTALAANLLRDDYQRESVIHWAQVIGTATVLVALFAWLTAVWLRPALLPHAMFATLFVFVLTGTWNFRGWYLIWLVGLAGVAFDRWVIRRVVAWSVGAMAAVPLFIWVWGWWRAPFFKVENVSILLIFGPILAVLMTEALVRSTAWRQVLSR